MSRLVPDGNLKIWAVNSIASQAGPTLVEITAGTELTPFVTPAGFDTPEEGTDADISNMSSARDFSVPATIGGDLQGEMYRDDGTGGTTDDAWIALPRNLQTNIVIARFGGGGTDNAIAVADVVEVWPVRVSQRSNNRPVRGEAFRFTGRYALESDPTLNAVVT